MGLEGLASAKALPSQLLQTTNTLIARFLSLKSSLLYGNKIHMFWDQGILPYSYFACRISFIAAVSTSFLVMTCFGPRIEPIASQTPYI